MFNLMFKGTVCVILGDLPSENMAMPDSHRYPENVYLSNIIPIFKSVIWKIYRIVSLIEKSQF